MIFIRSRYLLICLKTGAVSKRIQQINAQRRKQTKLWNKRIKFTEAIFLIRSRKWLRNSRRPSNLDVLNGCAVSLLGTKQCFTIITEIFGLSLADERGWKICYRKNKLTSVLNASVLLMTMKFVITLSK